MQSSVSVSVPIWLSLMRIAFATPPSMPRFRRSTFVTKTSSPTSCTLSPRRLVSAFQPSQSSSAQPSSIEMSGYFCGERLVDGDELVARDALLVEGVLAGLLVEELAGGAVERDEDVLARLVAGLLDGADDVLDGLLVRRELRREAALVADRDRVALVLEELLQRVEDLGARRAAPRRTSAGPRGTIMNSWISRPLSACTPPLRMFISGVGRTRACTPPR